MYIDIYLRGFSYSRTSWFNAHDRIVISNSRNVRTSSQIRMNFKTKPQNVRVGIRSVCLYSILTTAMVSSGCVYSSLQQIVCQIPVFSPYTITCHLKIQSIDPSLCRFPLYKIKVTNQHIVQLQ